MKALAKKDLERKEIALAKNTLESYVYATRSKLMEEGVRPLPLLL